MRWLPAIGILFCLSRPALAADESISVKAAVSKATITIGEPIEYRVTITHDSAIQILSSITPPSDNFQIKEVHDISEKQGKQIVEGRRFVFTIFELGEFILEPVTVQYRTPKGEEKSIQTNRIFLTVQSVNQSGKPMTDIRNVKGTLRLPRHWGWLVTLLILIITGGTGFYFWWRWKQREELSQAQEQTPLSFEDEALLRLNRLYDSDLLKRGKVKEYFLEFSDILRRYFEKCFEISAVESTTSEVLRDLQGKGISQDLAQKIQQALETADLAKFAKWKPAPTEILKMNQLAKIVIEDARPKIAV